MESPPLRAAIYVRQSLDRTGEGAAVDRQRKDCLALCKKRGYIVADVYDDNDTPASGPKPRPDYQRLLRDVRGGLVDVVVVWDLDRLTRRPVEVETWIELNEQYGVNLVTVGESIDLSTDNGRLFLRIKAAVARAEVERKSVRQKRANSERALEGRPAGGPRAFGYDPSGMHLVKAEADAVARAYRGMLAGASLRGIAAEWTAVGFHTSKGQAWTSRALRDRLLSPRYAGLSSYPKPVKAGEGKVGEVRHVIVGPGLWPAIVTEETWRQTVALLQEPSRRTTPGNARKYMLSGLARCGAVKKDGSACGALVATGRAQSGRRTYQCSVARHLSRGAEDIDGLVERLVLARLSQSDAAELLHDDQVPETAGLRDEAQALRARGDEVVTMYADGTLTLRQFEVANTKITADLAAVESRMALSSRNEVLRQLVVDTDPGQVWQALGVDRRRAVVQALLELTLLSPGKGRRTFDPDTVQVTWRG